MGTVVKGKRAVADRTDVTVLLTQYRAAKDAEAAAKEAAEMARESLVALAGDAEILVDSHNMQLCKVPERTRRSIPLAEALALHADLESIVHVSEYRVISR